MLNDLGVIFEEDLRVIAILSSLLDSWETVRTTLNAASKSLPSLNTVIPKLLDAEKTKSVDSKSAGEALAVCKGCSLSRGRECGQSRSRGCSANRDVEC